MTTATRPVHAGGPHSTPPPKACHCRPHPHHPCPHTPAATAKAKAAKAKAAHTRATNLAKARKILATHPPTPQQIANAVAIAKLKAAKSAKASAAKRAKMTVSQKAAAHSKAAAAAKKSAARRTGQKTGPRMSKKARAAAAKKRAMSAAALRLALQSVQAQNKQLAAAKVKHHRHANPHRPAPKRAAKKKC